MVKVRTQDLRKKAQNNNSLVSSRDVENFNKTFRGGMTVSEKNVRLWAARTGRGYEPVFRCIHSLIDRNTRRRVQRYVAGSYGVSAPVWELSNLLAPADRARAAVEILSSAR